MADELKLLAKKRGQIKARVTRFITFVGAYDNQQDDIIKMKLRLSKFEPTWQEFNEIQSQIENIDEEHIEDQLTERERFESDYFDVVAKAEAFIQQQSIAETVHSSNSDATQHVSHVKLPTLELPTFNGTYEQWTAFHDTFCSIIHDDVNIATIDKFRYLKSYLRGEAVKVLQSLELSTNNYAVAWVILKERFENKNLIIQGHVKALFDLPPVTRESATALRQLSDSFLKHIRALSALNQQTESWDVLIIYMLSTKFDTTTRRKWESIKLNNELPTLDDVIKFLSKRCQLLEAMDGGKEHAKSATSHNKIQRMVSHVATQGARGCNFCNKDHSIYKCTDFRNLTVEARIDEAKRLQLCLNCLKKNYFSAECRSSKCRQCKKPHNSLLHLNISQNIPNTSDTSTNLDANSEQELTITSHSIQERNTQILLATAIVRVTDAYGKQQEIRALLDSGSQSNFLIVDACERLNLQLKQINLPVSGINQIVTTIAQQTEVTIHSKYNGFKTTLKCLVIPKITQDLPATQLNFSQLNTPTHIKLADADFNKPAKIDMLIDAKIFYNLLCVGQIKNAINQPTLQKTHLGWIVSGAMSTVNQITTSCHFSINSSLQNEVERFWKIEERQVDKPNYSREEVACEDHFSSTVKRNNDGRYIVSLPFKQDVGSLGDTKKIALKRLYSLERRLERELENKQEYHKFMDEYEQLNHIALASDKEINAENFCYLPHHPVTKDTSLTTKLRVVFDASAKSDNGISLNDKLMIGPTIQDDLFAIILRFRQHRFVLTAYIEKMYRQVLVKPEHTSMQMILWRKNLSEPVKSYVLKTITYGTSSAPFQATRCLKQLAIDEGLAYPKAAEVLQSDFYVDDLISGTSSFEEIVELKTQLKNLLKRGQFNLRKWRSNDERISTDGTGNDCDDMFMLEKNDVQKTLGLYWNSREDTLQYTTNLMQSPKTITKRHILSMIAQIYDPLGLIGPILTQAKVIMQQLGQLKLEWDESVPISLFTMWKEFYKELACLNQLRIPRYVAPDDATTTIDIHGFCDASEVAYGACVYVTCASTSTLLCSKARVVPLKTISIPRLELCGAHCLAQLVNKVRQALTIKINNIYMWTDSTIVLSWLATQPAQLKTFVGNRVAEIQRLSVDVKWKHVPGKNNPADIISRGITPDKLLTNQLWWSGPDWLTLTKNHWPDDINIGNHNEPQFCAEFKLAALTITEPIEPCFIYKYSSFKRLLRIVAYCQRFSHNCQNKQRRKLNELTVSDIEAAKISVLLIVQQQEFCVDMKNLHRKQPLNKGSKLIKLNPFLDENGLIRVGGRLEKSNLSIDQKHPIVLPGNHFITQQIIREIHETNLHCGPQALLAALRLSYWPLSGRKICRQITHKCIACYKVKPKPAQCIMGDLPSTRTKAFIRPFSNTGVDYCGPFQVREGKGRGRKKITKGYIAVFVCFSTKAVHLEFVGDLTSEAFLGALKRFTSRRGICANIYSDNATNFVGANRELRELYDFLSQQENTISSSLANQKIQWHFIPPRAPHFGEIWEAAVKSAKSHLNRIIKNELLTYEEYHTLITQIESCLNSRSLTQLLSDPNDLSVLTPSHFLIGDSLLAPVEADYNVRDSLLSRWEHIQGLRQHFWKRWSREYLHQLQERSKWNVDDNQIQLDSLVVLMDDNMPPQKWTVGRVVQLHPGEDTIVRVVTVKTSNGLFKRAVRRLCVLPVVK